MTNIPKIKLGVVAVSRDCFPEALSTNRRRALIAAYEAAYGTGDVYASVFSGYLVSGYDALEAAKKAAEFTKAAMINTPPEHVYGVNFEGILNKITNREKI